MRINELLTESQLEQLEEGPKLDAFGRAVGKGIGTVAKGAGAVAGGVAGVGSAVKKGFTAGKQTVAAAGDDPAAAPSGTPTTAAPKQGIMGKIGNAIGKFKSGYNQATGASAAPSSAAPSAQTINQQGPAGTAPAVAQTGAAGAALAKTTAAVAKQSTAKAGQTVYAQVKANVDKLDKKGKQRILQLLQKSMATPDPKPTAGTAPAATTPPAATPKKNLGFGFNTDTGQAFSSAEERTAAGDAGTDAARLFPAAEPATAAPANTMANAPVSATNTAAADNPNQPPPVKKRGGRVAGAEPSTTPDAIRKRNARRDKKNAAATTGGAGAFNQLAQQATQQNASKINYGNALSEALAQRVEMHKQKMFETGLSQGTTSIFRK